MAEESFKNQVTAQARTRLISAIRGLERRLAEVELRDARKVDAVGLEALGVGIRGAIADAFGVGTFAFHQYEAAADFGVLYNASAIFVDRVIEAKRRSIALLHRAVAHSCKRQTFPDGSKSSRIACGGMAIGFLMDTETLRYQEIYGLGFIDGKDTNANTPNLTIGRCTRLN